MATGFYNNAAKLICDGTLDLVTTTLKLMLVTPSYTYDPDHTVIDNGGNDATDPSYNEISATNYTGGYGGGGRKTVTITGQVNNTLNRAEFAIADPTWTSLGGALNSTIGGAILVYETVDDPTSKLIAYFELTSTPTNGSSVTIDFNTLGANGNLRIST